MKKNSKKRRSSISALTQESRLSGARTQISQKLVEPQARSESVFRMLLASYEEVDALLSNLKAGRAKSDLISSVLLIRRWQLAHLLEFADPLKRLSYFSKVHEVSKTQKVKERKKS